MKNQFSVLVETYNTGAIKFEAWGDPEIKMYCPTGPSFRKWAENGELIEEMWSNKYGGVNREGGKPAWVKIDENTGVTYIEEYRVNGLFHREGVNNPAHIERDPKTGKETVLQFCINHKLHRDNQLPAVIATCPKTDIRYHESYWEHGNCLGIIERDLKSGVITYRGPPTEDQEHTLDEIPGYLNLTCKNCVSY